MTLKKLGLSLAVALALAAGGTHAQISDGVIKIGVMNDQSGTYADLAGPGSVVAARMAVEDFGARTSPRSARASRASGSTWTRWT